MKMLHRFYLVSTIAVLAAVTIRPALAADGAVRFQLVSGVPSVGVEGDKSDEWRFEVSNDLSSWRSASWLGTLFSSSTAGNVRMDTNRGGLATRFYRAVKTTGLHDPDALRTVTLTFTNSNWATLLANGRTTGSNTPATLVMDNGTTILGVGARYKGNTSYSMGGNKKSVNLEIDFTNPEARLMGYKTVNINNAAGDESILREPLYFTVMNRYAPSPKGSLVRLYINNEYWGLYSFAQQENNDLIEEWFPSSDGDRWSTPNAPGMTGGTTTPGGGGGGFPPGGGAGGGGGFSAGTSALLFLGTNMATYQANYILKSNNSSNAWQRLYHCIDVLNNTPAAEFKSRVQEVLAVDSWLWFLAVENIFADDDSYFNKGADYGFYYEPESGRIHPVEHDGNESFTAGDVQLSPVIGTGNTNRPVINKLLAVPEFRQRYLAHMRTVLAEAYHPDLFIPLIDRLSAMSVASVSEDTKKNYTMTAYTNDVAALKNFVRQRHAFLTNHAELKPLPPVIVSVHDPAQEPTPDVAPFVTARVEAQAGEGIDSVWLHFRERGYGKFETVQMFDDGAHGDGAAGDGVHGATTAKFPTGTRVRYYVEARSGNSAHAAAFAPARAEENTYSYRVVSATATSTRVVINELMADNAATVVDPQGDFDDWIELRNTTSQEVDLTGMYLTDNPTSPRKWAFPSGTKIAAGGYLLVWADEDTSAVHGLHASFKLAADGEQVLLIDTDANQNQILDSVTFGALGTDQAYGRTAAAPTQFSILSPTPGRANP